MTTKVSSLNDWKTFEWIPFNIPDLETVEGETRYYKVEDDLHLPSMTSLLSLLDDGGVDAWRKRVGEEEADKVVKDAVARGNNLHELSELYLMNKLERNAITGPAKVLFNRTRPFLNELGPIIAIEAALYSKKSAYAGRVDCIAFHEKNLCIVDHKNSRRQIDFSKSYARKKMFTYMVQTCGYARAFREMYPKFPAPTHGLLIFGNFESMNARKYKYELAPLEKELDIIIDAYYSRGDIKESRYFKL